MLMDMHNCDLLLGTAGTCKGAIVLLFGRIVMYIMASNAVTFLFVRLSRQVFFLLYSCEFVLYNVLLCL